MSASWIGSIISADCGDALGTYQGQVQTVDDGAQTLTLSGPFRNGLKCEVRELTLSAGDIKYLKILMSPKDAKGLVKKQSTPSKLSKDIMDEAIILGRVSPHLSNSPINGVGNGSSLQTGYTNGVGNSPVKTKLENNNSYYYGNCNGTATNGNHLNPNQRYTPTNEESRPRRNSTSESCTKKKSTTPRKIDFKKRSTPKDDCFSAPTDTYLDEFDFEKNLALFDKKAVFEEIESCDNLPIVYANNNKRKPVAKYRCDENVLQSEPVALTQIKVPASAYKKYVTDTGLVVPSISLDIRNQMMAAAEKVGLSESRLMEMLGRSASEMVLQLLGGSHRMSPQNNHQRPVVVLLCGPHKQGAQALNCARQLANHNVETVVFVPSSPFPQSLELELQLYQLTGHKTTSLLTDLPSGAVDMIITAMDSHEDMKLASEEWYKGLSEWVSKKLAPVLAIDPPPEGTPFQSKWNLGLGLPLNLPASCGQVYLSDLSIPKQVFTDLGIKYMSPFGHKFVIPLHLKP